MGYLIIRIEPAENDTLPEREKLPGRVELRRRHALRDPEVVTVRDLLEKGGFELGPIVGGSAPRDDWPFTAYVYTSTNPEGHGRAGSCLHRWPVREKGD